MKATELNEPGAGEPAAIERLQRFRGELAELAFSLETRGRLDAADVVNALSARVAEMEEELTASARPNGA